MASLKAFCLAGVAILAVTATAYAADLPEPPPVEAPVFLPQPLVGGGWYLRGDVGAGALQLRDEGTSFDAGAYGTSNDKPPGFQFDGATVQEQGLVDLGAGYQFNSYFRADVTGEYRFASHYHATETATGCNGPDGPCADAYSSSISNGVFLVNGYVDLGTIDRITPYLGVGAGVALNHFSGDTDYNLNFNDAAAGTSSANMRTSFAYAAMAGFSFDLTQSLKLDFGYRYIDMGKAESGGINCFTGFCGHEHQSYRLSSHDIRLGLRYTFADLIPYTPQLPLIRKY